MSSSKSKDSNSPEAQVYQSLTAADTKNTATTVAFVVLVAILLLFKLLDFMTISKLSDELVEAQLKRNLIVVETERGRLQSIDNLPEAFVLDYAEGFVNNLLNNTEGTFRKNHAYARQKLNPAYNVSLTEAFESYEEAIVKDRISTDWKRRSAAVKSLPNNSQLYRFEGFFRAFAGTTQFKDGMDYVEVEIARVTPTESLPLGLEIVRFDAPIFRGAK